MSSHLDSLGKIFSGIDSNGIDKVFLKNDKGEIIVEKKGGTLSRWRLMRSMKKETSVRDAYNFRDNAEKIKGMFVEAVKEIRNNDNESLEKLKAYQKMFNTLVEHVVEKREKLTVWQSIVKYIHKGVETTPKQQDALILRHLKVDVDSLSEKLKRKN
jgi:hypothetical protein